MSSYRVLEDSYRALLAVITGLDDDTGWRPTALPGWTVRDLTFHLLGDAQRALVALHTPAAGPADDVQYALVGTGREPLDDAERAGLGDDAGRFPLFG